MALATCCPDCGTTFRVVSDQLKIRNGLVRCGSCRKIFNGIEHMRYVSNVSPATTVTPPPTTTASTPTATASPTPTTTTPASPPTQPATPTERITEIKNELKKELRSARRRRKQAEEDLPPMTLMDITSEDAPPIYTNATESYAKDYPSYARQTKIPSFLRVGKKRAPWWLRLLWSALIFLATLVLLMQIAYRYRHDLAAYGDRFTPEVRSALENACSTLHKAWRCSIDLPRHLNSLRVTSAEIEESAVPDYYLLRLTLRNESRLAQALPFIDMTLSDARNAIVTRRALSPQEYLVDATESIRLGIAAQSERSFTIPIRFNQTTANPVPTKINGYLVDIFYP